MESNMKRTNKIVRCILCTMLVIMTLGLTGCNSQNNFIWFYDDETSVIQITNETKKEIAVEIKVSVGEMKATKHVVLRGFQTNEVDLHEYFLENNLKTYEEIISIKEVYFSDFNEGIQTALLTLSVTLVVMIVLVINYFSQIIKKTKQK